MCLFHIRFELPFNRSYVKDAQKNNLPHRKQSTSSNRLSLIFSYTQNNQQLYKLLINTTIRDVQVLLQKRKVLNMLWYKYVSWRIWRLCCKPSFFPDGPNATYGFSKYAMHARMPTEGNNIQRRKGMRPGMPHVQTNQSNWTAYTIARRSFWEGSALRETTPKSNTAKQPVDLSVSITYWIEMTIVHVL